MEVPHLGIGPTKRSRLWSGMMLVTLITVVMVSVMLSVSGPMRVICFALFARCMAMSDSRGGNSGAEQRRCRQTLVALLHEGTVIWQARSSTGHRYFTPAHDIRRGPPTVKPDPLVRWVTATEGLTRLPALFRLHCSIFYVSSHYIRMTIAVEP